MIEYIFVCMSNHKDLKN